MRKEKFGFNITYIFIGIILLVLIVGAYFWGRNTQTIPSKTIQNQTIVGKTMDEVLQTGEPLDTKENPNTKRAVWVYSLSNEDATSTYLYFENGKVVSTKTDEYNGDLSSDPWVQ